MAYQTRRRDPLLDEETAAVIERRGRELAGLALLAAGAALLAVMWSYSPGDPSWLASTEGAVANWLGRPGAAVASPLRVIVGGGAYALGLILVAWGVRLTLHLGEAKLSRRILFAPLAVALASLHAATLVPGADWGHSFGMGGLFGDTVLGAMLAGLPFATTASLRALAALSGAGALTLILFAAGVDRFELRRVGLFLLRGLILTYAGLAGRTGRGAAALGDRARARAQARREVRARRAEIEAAEEPEGAAAAPARPGVLRRVRSALAGLGGRLPRLRLRRRVAEATPVRGEAEDARRDDDPSERLRAGFRASMGAGRLEDGGPAHAPRGDPATPSYGDPELSSLRAGRDEPPLTGLVRRPDAPGAPVRRAPLVAQAATGPVPYPEVVVAAPSHEPGAAAGPRGASEAELAWAAAQQSLAAFRAELAASGMSSGRAPTAESAAPEPNSGPAPVHKAPSRLPPPVSAEPRITEIDDPEDRDASARAVAVEPDAPRSVPLPRFLQPGAPEADAPTEDGPSRPTPAAAPADPEPAPAAVRRGAVRPVRAPAPVAEYERPPLELLTDPATVERHHLSDDALEDNARLLMSVLEDYGVKGEIVSVRPGPVVTMYELEPAPGLKASRVIGLADDIARSMSALSARVSTVPGRSVIGIELPNDKREKVVLREILSARGFDGSMRLPLALGKTIGGDAEVADLARMPHLLIAGTTGSGKSVAINTMILSLLYTLSPEQCRVIMIDPKMLELSVYDGIPHLLSPVVTDPKKAVVALKWVVAEMEERYRRMSKLGVRNIDGFNGRVREALAKGETFTRTVQTGFDDETGDPVFETEETVPETIPYIVVVVDEMADLMMVAGKEIEACIQRLAQMARASGIHLIMATQRPSVDVITGTIKANFPTRISFQVTSKIDSRTILGEMGAEQLLGMGDMLHMAGGSRITRVHGPFVSDREVEEVVSHLKDLGPPEYVGAVVEGPEEGEASVDAVLGLGDSGGEDALYDQAVAIVAKDRKCSTSYIQRKLGIGYNKAARLVEQMEDEGVVSPSNHVGKRDVLVPEAP